MKKLLLSAFAVASALAMNAQTAGISTEAAYDDFATTRENPYNVLVSDNGTPDDYEDDIYKGIFWWEDTTSTTVFATSYEREGNGKLIYTIKQAESAFEPIGVGFGEDADGNLFTIDLSNDANVSFALTNTSDATIEVKVAIQDINGITLGFDKSLLGEPGGALGDNRPLYKYEIGATGGSGSDVPLGTFGTGYDAETATGRVAFLESDDVLNFDYDFKNALAAEYAFNENGNTNPNTGEKCNNFSQFQCENGTCFDYTQVTALTITVVNTEASETECYTKVAFDGTVELTDVKIGDISTIVAGLFDFGASSNDFEVYPNPATDNVNFAKRLTNVEVYNAQGSLVETLGSANALNVSSYEAGVYFIKATEGTSRVVVK